MGGGPSRRSVVTGGLNTLMANSFLSVTENCQTYANLDQDISISCDPSAVNNNPNEYYEDNSACSQCYLNILEQQRGRYELIRRQFRPGHASIPMTPQTDATNLLNNLDTCLRYCKACQFGNFSQVNSFKWKQGCQLLTNVLQDFSDSLQASITQTLTDNQDILSSLSQALGASDKQSAIAYIVNRVRDNVSTEFLQSLSEVVETNQRLTINADAPAAFNGSTQFQAITALSNAFAEAGIADNILSNEQWTIYQRLYNEENTLGELGNAIKKSIIGIEDIVKSLLGKILISVIIIATIVIAIIAIIGITQAVKRKKALKPSL